MSVTTVDATGITTTHPRKEFALVYQLPKFLSADLLVNAKSYKRVGPKESVTRGVTRGNDGSWHYYFSATALAAEVGAIGERRHFSVCTANGRRSVHISMKPHDATETKPAKRDEIMIWYRFEKQWTGKKEEAEGWGRTKFNGKDADRVAKAVLLLTKFLEAMTAVAEGTGVPKTPTAPVMTPPLATFRQISDEEAEAIFEASKEQPKPAAAAASTAPANWEDW